MANGVFEAATPEEGARRREQHRPDPRQDIPEQIGQIKQCIANLTRPHYRQIDLLRVSIENLENDYDLLRNEEDIRRHWEGGVLPTLKRLKKLREKLKKKYDLLMGELNKKNALDALNKELDQRRDELA